MDDCSVIENCPPSGAGLPGTEEDAMTNDDFRKIATAQATLALSVVDTLEACLDVQNMPPDIRVPIWRALARYAETRAKECEGTEE
jgi:hypothetical protein